MTEHLKGKDSCITLRRRGSEIPRSEISDRVTVVVAEKHPRQSASVSLENQCWHHARPRLIEDHALNRRTPQNFFAPLPLQPLRCLDASTVQTETGDIGTRQVKHIKGQPRPKPPSSSMGRSSSKELPQRSQLWNGPG